MATHRKRDEWNRGAIWVAAEKAATELGKAVCAHPAAEDHTLVGIFVGNRRAVDG
jgi:hypothetical protein